MRILEHCKNPAFFFPVVVSIAMYVIGLIIGNEHPIALALLLLGTYVFGGIATYIWHIDKDCVERRINND